MKDFNDFLLKYSYFDIVPDCVDFMVVLTSMRKLSLSAGSNGGPLPYASSSFCVSASFVSICSSKRGRDFYITYYKYELYAYE